MNLSRQCQPQTRGCRKLFSRGTVIRIVQSVTPDRRTVASAHQRIDELMLQVREHVVSCSSETRQQNSRLKRVEMILLTSTGAILLLLISLVLR